MTYQGLKIDVMQTMKFKWHYRTVRYFVSAFLEIIYPDYLHGAKYINISRKLRRRLEKSISSRSSHLPHITCPEAMSIEQLNDLAKGRNSFMYM